AIAKDKITIRDLWFADTKALRRLQDSLALESVRDVCRGDDDKEISEAEYFEKINDDQFWTGFVMESIKELIEKDRTMVSIKPALIQAMTEWTINEISSIDFEKTTIIEHEGGGYSYFPHTEFVKQAVELLKPALPDDLLLKLLKTDYSSFYSLDAPEDESQKRQPLAALIIEQVKDKSRLKQQIIANIKDSRTPFRVRSTHFKICQVLSYNECLPELYAAVTEQKMVDGFDRVKLSEIYVALGGKWTDFSHLLAVPECPSYEKSFVDFHWHLLEKLLHHETEKVGAILIEILQKDPVESNQLKAAEFLIKLSRIEGLRYWLQHVKTKKGMPFESRWETFYDYIRKMPLAETVDILMEALDSIYQVPLTNPDAHFWRLDDTIFNGLVNLAIQGQFQFEHIQQKVDSLLNKTTGENQRYTIKFFKEKIRNSYYQSINQEMSIRQANEIYEKNLAIVLA
ncbi:MAG TPA: hypothetical protein VK588_04210, partial [Chitinophagaceae bacterium]|nr:hypothetical protein [Chitinophagaceae bacterium]